MQPYKTIGTFLDTKRPSLFSAGKKNFLAVSTNNCYKVYKMPEMKIRLLGPHFEPKIRFILGGSGNKLYIALKNKIL